MSEFEKRSGMNSQAIGRRTCLPTEQIETRHTYKVN